MAKIDKWRKAKNLKKITVWASNGHNTVTVIAHKIGIHPATLYRWIETYPEIKNAYEEGRRNVDEEAERALRYLCTGYHETEKKMCKIAVKKYNNVGKVAEIEEKYVPVLQNVYIPPNASAAIFYLCNHMPDKWKWKGGAKAESREKSSGSGVVLLPSDADGAGENVEGACKDD